ncbi:MAG: hypothetical protein QM346_20350 [Chloroflexota bacterium]|nr:hypothetical protein [Chloroflexota bacterium]
MNQPTTERNYYLYQRSQWLRPSVYPLERTPNPALYRPVAQWIGRLILPAQTERDADGGCFFEVHHAPAPFDRLAGRILWLRFDTERMIQARTWAATRNVIFNRDAEKLATNGLILAERVNRWRLVTPLESLAGSRPADDLIVRLPDTVTVEKPDSADPSLRITHEPVQITGRFVGLVIFIGPEHDAHDRWRVRHFNPATHAFDGQEEVIVVPPATANEDGTLPSTAAQIETSPLNPDGWYIYGAPDAQGVFVVQAWMPRALVRLKPQRVLSTRDEAWQHVRHEAWADLRAKKGTISSVLYMPRVAGAASAVETWRQGDRALLLHVYAGIGGKQREPAARAGLYFGHFAFGIADVIREPLADELRFDITYYQIYTHNVDGLVAGAMDWSRYMGDRQFGWAGLRPVCDILVRLEGLNDLYPVDGRLYSVLDAIRDNLEQMAARYRIGDGRGATYVAAANNCAQDSSQALYAAIIEIRELLETSTDLAAWTAQHPEQAARLRKLQSLGQELRRKLVGGNARRADWRYGVQNLGITENPLRNFLRGLATWRTVLPRKTSDTFAQVFLEHDASLWTLCAYQVGGYNPDIEPIPAWTF